jgi:predicted RNase H-like nuclease (RuvC/YqgF family)
MTKAELEKYVARLEKKLEKADVSRYKEDIENYKKRHEEITKESYDRRVKIDILEKELKQVKGIREDLGIRYNELAKLFDEHLAAFNDMIETNKLFLRTIVRAKELMEIKINAFNTKGKGDEK